MATGASIMVINTSKPSRVPRPCSPLKSRANRRHLNSTSSFDSAEKMPPQFIEKRAPQNYPNVRNRLAEQEQKSLNQTYTLGSNSRQSSTSFRKRSGSIDSDFADYASNTIAGIFPRSRAGNPRKQGNQSQAITRMLSSQLPSINDCSSERLCCQRACWSRTQFELAKFKDTLKQIN